jgi:hypothetical protein
MYCCLSLKKDKDSQWTGQCRVGRWFVIGQMLYTAANDVAVCVKVFFVFFSSRVTSNNRFKFPSFTWGHKIKK